MHKFFALIVNLTLGLLLTVPNSISQEPSWPHFGGPNRDFALTGSSSTWKGLRARWRKPLGQGASGIVGDHQRLYTMYSVPDAKNKNRGEELVAAFDAKTGEQIWKHSDVVERLKGQESFRGDAIRPQATPTLADGRVFTLGYTGLLNCFDAEEGKILWRKDLVQNFGAKPVQFGFSSSPLVTGNRLLVHVGGKEASVVAMNCASGEVLWKAEAAEPSYATPVLFTMDGVNQIVQVTRDSVLGIDLQSGRTLWKYGLPESGLTNVPTPIVLDGTKLLVAGQGFLGTRLIEIRKTGEGFEAAELWSNNKIKPFYSNIVHNGQIAICAFDDFVGAIELKEGKELWRVRGEKDTNFVRLADGLLGLREDGRLSLFNLAEKGLTSRWSAETFRGRTWASPTLLGDAIYIRSESEIQAFDLVR